ncbi:uncharacterized protein LOC124698613 [Lolium rigidum]|uniref:uncharacterized protein LOC124698613 n=1 Tax=Lolium rigidum TaxID=89674 RepID=UPI001F5D6484|nr:uncharacterized protein LOC124698613 [Lolium rigidum]
MAGSWSSSSARTSSLGSLGDDDDVVFVMKPDSSASGKGNSVVKFLCSYGGRILPRHSDGALRYVGGNNRVLSLDRSLQFYELQRKLRDMCGWEAMSLRCQLPTEDLDALVSVTSKDDLSNLLEEYDAASRDRLQPLKIRAFLFPRATPPLSPSTSTPSSRPMSAHVRQQHYRQTITPSPAVRLPRQQHYHRRPHQHHAVHTGIQLQ